MFPDVEVVTVQIGEIEDRYKDNKTKLSRILKKLREEYGLMSFLPPCFHLASPKSVWAVPKKRYGEFMRFLESRGYLK